MEEGIRKCLIFVMRQISSKIFGKIIIIKQRRMNEQLQILLRHLECFSRDVKVLWIA